MLTSISPLGERARGQRYGLTVAAHLLGGALGGATTGAVLGLAGSVLGLGGRTSLLVAAAVCLLAVLAERRPVHVGRRQVDEDWLSRYRGWVYGGGYGFQLGLGVVTVVTSAATPALLALLVLTGSPGVAALLGAGFGLVRGLPLLALRRVDTPDQLRAAAARAERLARPAGRATTAALAVAGVALAAGALA
jgi:hypothetical protein